MAHRCSQRIINYFQAFACNVGKVNQSNLCVCVGLVRMLICSDVGVAGDAGQVAAVWPVCGHTEMLQLGQSLFQVMVEDFVDHI